MKETKNRYVAVAYKLYAIDEDGNEPVEEATTEQPYQFITGFGITLKDFEKNIEGLATGDTFDFTLSEEQAFGPYLDEHVVALDKSVFTINGHFDHDNVYVDAVIPLQNEDGNMFHGLVTEITDDKVTVDLNHPLAGSALRFVGQVVENREATAQEIEGTIARLSGSGCGCSCHHDHDHDHGCGCSHDHCGGGCC